MENQLGNLTFEPHLNMAARCFGDETRLLLLHYLAEVLYHALPDEEPHANLYDQLVVFLEAFPQPDLWQRLAFFELKLLLVLGYGLSLSHENAVPCPQGAPLKYVSPKSGRAVSAAVGQPYADKLLRLPALFGGEQCAEDKDFLDVFRLTGHFLEKALHGKSLHTRDALLDKGRATDFVTGKNASQ